MAKSKQSQAQVPNSGAARAPVGHTGAAAPDPFLGLRLLQATERSSRGRGRRPRGAAGIQSLEQGLAVMQVLAEGGILRLKDLAQRCRMSPSKAHRYLVSLTRSGWAAQIEGGYGLGAGAVTMASACLATVSATRLAGPVLERLGRLTGRTAGLAVWGTHGPTIVVIEESAHPVSMNIRPGTTAPVLCSASGLLFAAFAQPGQTAELVARELRERPRRHRFVNRAALDAELRRIRERGWSVVASDWIPGVDAFAAPVLDHRGRIVAALLSVGRDEGAGARAAAGGDLAGSRQPRDLAEIIDRITQAASELSARLGFRGLPGDARSRLSDDDVNVGAPRLLVK